MTVNKVKDEVKVEHVLNKKLIENKKNKNKLIGYFVIVQNDLISY